jgi:sugar phosphate permease
VRQPELQPKPSGGDTRKRPFYGWTIVGIVALLSFAGGVETNPVLGVFQGPVTEEFGWSRAMFTLPMAIGSFAGGVLALVIGPLMDRYGARVIMGVAVVIMGFIFVLMSGMQELWQHFVLQILGRTLVASTFFMIIGVVLPKWFVTKRGRAIGLAGLGQRVGHIAFPVTIELVLRVGTWRYAALTMGIIVWATALLPTLLFIRRRPEDHGLLPDGALPDLRTSGGEPHPAHTHDETSFTRAAALRTSAFYLIAISLTIQSFVSTGINFHWYSYLTDKGLSGGVAVISLSLGPLVGMPVSVLAGFLTEKFPAQYLMAVSYVIMSASIGVFLLTDNALFAYAFGVLYGIATGMQITVMQIIWADYYGRGSIGAIRGVVSPVHMLANALGPVVAAFTFDRTGGYELIFTNSMILALVAAVLVALAKRPRAPESAFRERA